MQILGRGLFSYKNVKSHTDSQRKSQKSAASTELTQIRAVISTPYYAMDFLLHEG
jgi:hypothetical protein